MIPTYARVIIERVPDENEDILFETNFELEIKSSSINDLESKSTNSDHSYVRKTILERKTNEVCDNGQKAAEVDSLTKKQYEEDEIFQSDDDESDHESQEMPETRFESCQHLEKSKPSSSALRNYIKKTLD